MANYSNDEENEAIHYEAPDKNWDAHVYDYDGHQPADSLVGARCK
jgi:hypothetical protein